MNLLPRPKSRRRQASRRGVAMLEMAIVLPILLLLLMGIIEMGRAVMLYQVMTNATREAARRAVVPGATDDAVLATCNAYLDRGGVSGTGRTVEILDSGGSSASMSAISSHSPVTVRATIPFAENTWGFSLFFGGRSLTSSATMRRE